MKIACFALASALALGIVQPADAKSARVLGMSAMRTSPGWSYPIVAVVPRGKLVNARYCISNGWCRVKWRGKSGWIEWKSLRTHHIKRKVERR
jgi:uncharacterized protein YraI